MVRLEVWGDPLALYHPQPCGCRSPATVDTVLRNVDVTVSKLRTITALCHRGIDLASWIIFARK